jgi:5-methyltetrahydrofolate--homocysteine methyltransferase
MRPGRILSGQTVTAFWHSVRHAQPLAIGLNCALGAALMRPYIQELNRVAPDTFISCYPNAGLPNPMSDTGFDETPDVTSRLVREFAECSARGAGQYRGWLLRHHARPHWRHCGRCHAGSADRRNARHVRQHRRAHQCDRLQGFARMILNGDFEQALAVARQQVENGAQVIDINMDEAMLDSQAAMVRFLNLIASEPDISRVPVMIDSSKWSVIEAGLRCVQGKGIVNSISMKEGVEPSSARPNWCAATAPLRWSWPLTKKARPTPTAQDRDLRARLPHPGGRSGFPGGRHHLRPQHLRHRHRH